jgi:hypothetical protein
MVGFANIVRSYSSMRLGRLHTANTKCAVRRQDISTAGWIVYENAVSALDFSRMRKSSTGHTTATQQIAHLSLLSKAIVAIKDTSKFMSCKACNSTRDISFCFKDPYIGRDGGLWKSCT